MTTLTEGKIRTQVKNQTDSPAPVKLPQGPKEDMVDFYWPRSFSSGKIADERREAE